MAAPRLDVRLNRRRYTVFVANHQTSFSFLKNQKRGVEHCLGTQRLFPDPYASLPLLPFNPRFPFLIPSLPSSKLPLFCRLDPQYSAQSASLFCWCLDPSLFGCLLVPFLTFENSIIKKTIITTVLFYPIIPTLFLDTLYDRRFPVFWFIINFLRRPSPCIK